MMLLWIASEKVILLSFSDGDQWDMQLKATHGNRNWLNKRLQSTATNNSYAVMEDRLANYKAVAGIQAITDINSLSHVQATHSPTWVEGKKMTPLEGAGEQTLDVALTFRWLLALGLRLLLFQLSAPLSLQNRVLILGLPVYVTGMMVGGTRLTGVGNKRWQVGGIIIRYRSKYRKQDVGRRENISRIGEKIGTYKREGRRNNDNLLLTHSHQYTSCNSSHKISQILIIGLYGGYLLT